jgi:membrane-bound lytic murein transglycosylase D
MAASDSTDQAGHGGGACRAWRLAAVALSLALTSLAAPVSHAQSADAGDGWGRLSAISQSSPAEAADLSAIGGGPEAGGFSLPSVTLRELNLVPAADLTRAPTSIWVRIRNGFAMPDLVHPMVRQEEDFYANRPEHLRRVVERSRRYLFHIVEVVERRGMPSELALLPIIESAFNPVAVSSARAAGMWQFIPSTGLNFGLRQNSWLDGRRDILASTEAALDYLQKLYDMFGSWDLALAAYNCGEGCVQRAIARNAMRGDRVDFASLQLPAETRAYVPKLQAVKNIIANPKQFNMTLAEVPNEAFFATVRVDQHMDVKVAAKLAGMSVEEFVALNPAHNRSVINANKLPTLLLPLDRVNQFASSLRDLGDRALASMRIYTPRAGEPIDQIAKRHGISPVVLRQANGLPRSARVAAGDLDLMIPSGSALVAAAAAAEAAPRASARAAPAAARPGAAPGKRAATAASPKQGAATRAATPQARKAGANQRPAAKAPGKAPGTPAQRAAVAPAKKAAPAAAPAARTTLASAQPPARR